MARNTREDLKNMSANIRVAWLDGPPTPMRNAWPRARARDPRMGHGQRVPGGLQKHTLKYLVQIWHTFGTNVRGFRCISIRGNYSRLIIIIPARPQPRGAAHHRSLHNIEQYQATSGSIGQHQATSGNIRQHQATSGSIGQCQATSGNLRQHQATSSNNEQHRATSYNIRQHQATSGNTKQHQATSDNIRQYQATSGNIGQHSATLGNIRQH